MYKIVSIPQKDWNNTVKQLWEEWRTYDLQEKEPIIEKIPAIKEVSIDLNDIISYEREKTLLFFYNNVAIGVLRIQDFSDKSSLLKVAGVGSVAVDQKYRNNGVGKKLMEIANLYIKSSKYDASILYSSLYATQYNFYEKFGYKTLDDEFIFNDKKYKVHIKYYNKIKDDKEELVRLIKKIGKF